MKKDSLYILIPAYNEAENIESIIREWYPHIADKGDNSRLVINCSGSSDNTAIIVETLKKEFDKLETILDSQNTYGYKVLDLYDYALCKDADYIFQTDSDGQTNAKEFYDFWNLRDKYDAIIGYRNKRQDGVLRCLVMKVECMVISICTGVKVPDANAPFRLMTRNVLKKNISQISRDYSMPNMALTAFMVRNQENILFHKISFAARKTGFQSMNFRKIFSIGIESIRYFNKVKRGF